MESKNKIRIVRDRQLDLLTAYLKDGNEIELEAIEADNIIFYVDPKSKELVMIQVYNFNAFRKEMLRDMMIVVTKKAIQRLIELIADAFRSNNSFRHKFAA